jgi:hypothetical protein
MKDFALSDAAPASPTMRDDFQRVLTLIARRADELSQAGQKGHDFDLAYWVQAEREVLGSDPGSPVG